jgi:polysaccharide export outer membrane protein
LERSHRLLDAIGAANGYTKDAAKRKVFIIRKESVDKPLQVDLLRLLKNGDTTQNYVLNDGDTVYLTDNNRIDFGRDILPFLTAAWYVNDAQKH